MILRALAAFVMLCGCATPRAIGPPTTYRGGPATRSRADDAAMIVIPAGAYVAGSTDAERARAYDDSARTAGNEGARRGRWFAREHPRGTATLPAFRIDRTPVSNAAYAEYLADTGVAPPTIDRATWDRQGFNQDFGREVVRFRWTTRAPPPGRAEHPVVLVTHAEAAAYCAWRGAMLGAARRLPSAAEFEKAARGEHGAIYPWGDDFDPSRLNSAVVGPRDTAPVGSWPTGASPYGMLDAAGNVFQWTSSPWRHRPGAMTVKGSAWDDHGGVGRGAAAHGRPRGVRHAIVGFRCAGS